MYQTPTLPHAPIRLLVLLGTAALLIYISFNFLGEAYDSFAGLHPEGLSGDDAPFVAADQMGTITQTATPQIGPGQPAQATATPTPFSPYQATVALVLFPSPTATFTPTATITPAPGSSRINPVDGMLMLYVPAGEYNMGRGTHNGEIERDDQPPHKVYVSAFWISQTQVTNAQYRRCVEAGVCGQPIREEINPHYYDSAYSRHPVVYIAWPLAATYCGWTGGRLPTEAEWERAASGDSNRDYAWGNEFNGREMANVDNVHGGTVEVGSYPQNASPYGVLDMGSNVREWVADWYSNSYYLGSPYENPSGPEKGSKRSLRGASWHDPKERARVTQRYGHEPGSAGDNRGFRCVYP